MTAAIGSVAGYAWWVTTLRPFTWPVLAAVEGAGLAAIVIGSQWRRPPDAGVVRRGAGLWVALILLMGAWELAAYVQHPRAEHPTLSALADGVLDERPTRALGLMAWLLLTARVARR